MSGFEFASLPLETARRVDDICSAFEDSYANGNRPQIEAFVQSLHGPVNQAALHALILAELEISCWDGRLETRAQYIQRFPDHQDIVLAALDCAAGRLATDDERAPVRCPNCNSSLPISEVELSGIYCSSCGSTFNLVGDGTVIDTSSFKDMGHFELLEEVGIGTFGSVWKARDTELDRLVAVKIPRTLVAGTNAAEQFLREAKAAAQLNHPNIVRVHEIGRADETLYIVSEFVNGVTLADWLTRDSMSAPTAASLCAVVADALHHAHEKGVVHRDLTTSNIMMDANANPHVMDFGMAKRDAGDITMTIDGKVLGTPAYISPEQAVGEAHNADRRSDIYSLGVILFELLTGERPFRGNTRMLLHQAIAEQPPSPRKLNHSVPRDLETICLKCLEKDPRGRFQTAVELSTELRRYVKGEPIRSRPISGLTRSVRWTRRNPVPVLVVGLLLVAISASAGILAIELRRQRDQQAADAKRYEERLKAREREQVAAKRGRLAEARNARFREDGWSERIEKEVSYLGRRTNDLDTRSLAVAALTGIDAERRRPPLNRPASHLSFDAQNTLLLGMQPADDKNQAVPAVLIPTSRDMQEKVTVSSQLGRVLLDRTGRACEFVYSVQDHHWQLTRIGNSERIAEFRMPDEVSVTDCGPPWPQVVVTQTGFVVAGLFNTRKPHQHVLCWRYPETYPAHSFETEATVLALSKTGNYVATGSKHGVVNVWSVVTGDRVSQFNVASAAVHTLEFGPRDKLLAVGGNGGYLQTWNWERRERAGKYVGGAFDTFAVAFHPTETMLAAGGRESLKLWDTRTRDLLLEVRDFDFCEHLAFSPRGDCLAATSTEKRQTAIWDLHYPIAVFELRGLSGAIGRVEFSPDGTRIGAVTHERSIGIWNVDRRELQTITETGNGTSVDNVDLAFGPNDQFAFADGQHVRLWNAQGDVTEWPLPRDGRQQAVFFDAKGNLRHYHTEIRDEGEENIRIPVFRELGLDNTIRTRACEITFDEPWSAAFMPDGSLVIVDGKMRTNGRSERVLWAHDGERELWRTPLPHKVTYGKLVLNPTGEVLFARWDEESQGARIDARSGNVVDSLPYFPDAVDRAGKYAARLWVEQIELLRQVDGTVRLTFPMASKAKSKPTFSPDGRWLAWGTTDGIVYLCDIPQLERQLRSFGLSWERNR